MSLQTIFGSDAVIFLFRKGSDTAMLRMFRQIIIRTIQRNEARVQIIRAHRLIADGRNHVHEQIPFIRRPKDWPFPIPEITAEAINDLVDAIERGDRYLGSLYDELDGATREMDNLDQETLVRNYYLLEEWDSDAK